MAKVIVFSNVLDLSEKESFDAVRGETVEQFLGRTSLTDRTFSSVCEVYDPETGETSYCAIEDDPNESMKVSISVNGEQKTPDYEIQESDLVVIQIFPASDSGRVAEAILGGALVVGGILLAWFTAGSSLAGTWAGLGVLGIGVGVGALGAWLVYDALKDPKDKDKKKRELASDQQPTISGAQNQLLEGPFPLLIGKITATPYVVGSLYNDFVIDPNDHATYFGSRQKATLLLAVAYAPIYIEDIKFDSLIIAKNKNHVLSGPLYHNFVTLGKEKYAENPWEPGSPITFNGERALYEVESMWNSNKIKFEISQFGNHRFLYPVTVKQAQVDEAVLYCYDHDYKEVADENTITWQGGTFPTGMRTNTIKFSESVPWKVSVGIEFPNGLYRQHNTEEGTAIYTKIPMNLVIQWRPVYKYVRKNDLDTLGDGNDVYEMSPEEIAADTYDRKRFFGWRNFTDVQVAGGPVSKIKYTSYTNKTCYNYWYYDGNGNKVPSRSGDSYGYYQSLEEDTNDGIFHPQLKSIDKSAKQNNLSVQYTYKYLTQTLSAEEVQTLRAYSGAAYEYYLKGNTILKSLIISAKKNGGYTYSTGNAVYGVSGNSRSTSSVYGTSTPSNMSGVYGGSSSNKTTVTIGYSSYALQLQSQLPSASRDAINAICSDMANSMNDDEYWVMSHENATAASYSDSVSRRECELNKGLSEGTSNDCNPTWQGVTAFSFGQASCGRRIWDEVNKQDPSLTNGDITFADDSYSSELSFAESPMKFEVSASLSKEDILDLLGQNPKSKNTEYNDSYLAGLTDVAIDGIQVRVIRLTPCYINKTDGKRSYKYADVVKWTYLKSYCVDKQKLLDDIKNMSESAQVIDPATGNMKTVVYSKIDCSPDTYKNPTIHPDGPTWLNWNISDYYAKPVSDDDMQKLALLAVECEPDVLGRISSSIDKINLTGYAITPTLLHDWTRYWYVINGEYYRCDYYDSSETRELALHPMWGPDDYMWVKSTYEEFNHSGVTLIDGEEYEGQYWYEEMNGDWQSEFFPNKIEPMKALQIETDDNGTPLYNDKGEVLTEMVRQGNDWIPYIANYMSEHQDSAGRWIATNAFRNAFLNQNAIAQVLGFMCGQSLGKDAYCYNSLNNKKFVRYWYVYDDGNGNVKYYYRDTDDTAFNPNREITYDPEQPSNQYLWTLSTEMDWNAAERTDIGNGYSYSMRKPGSSFNMLALKEAYEYTDAIDIGGSFGPLSYKCNMYVTSQQKVVDLMNTILACGRAFWFYDEMGRLEFHNDKPRKYPVMTISDENMISSTFSRTFARGIAGYHGTFQDENNDFQTGEIYVLKQGQSRDAHTRDIIDTSITGVTDPKQMWALLVYMVAMSITRREAWEVSLNHAGGGLTIGSMVEMQSSTLEIGTDNSGRIAKLIEDNDYIYGFIADRMYEYRAEYNEDGSNVQGCSLLQPKAKLHSKVVTMRFASREQQSTGFVIDGMTLANLKGQTNLILFEKRIAKNQERQDGQEADEDTGTRLYTQFIPAQGDIVMFGNVGSITQKAIVYELQYDEKGKVTASLYPYFDSLYSAGGGYPVYQTSMTKKARNDSVPVSMEAKRTELDQESMRLQKESNAAINGIISGGYGEISAPVPVSNVAAVAKRDQIDITWRFNGTGLSNTIESFTVVITKKNGDVVTVHPADTKYSYAFTRYDANENVVDGYPEAADLEDWSVTVTPVNVYGMAGETSSAVYVNADADHYGTWLVGTPVVETKVVDRTVILQLSAARTSNNREIYGDIRYQVRVRRSSFNYTSVKYWMHDTSNNEYYYTITNDSKLDETRKKDNTWTVGTQQQYEADSLLDSFGLFNSSSDSSSSHEYAYCSHTQIVAADSVWHKPSSNKDPYADSDNYYDTDTGTQGSRFVVASATYTQTMPLYYTDTSDLQNPVYNLTNTPYWFDIRCFNEAGSGTWLSGASDWSSGHEGIQVVALCTNIQDIVKANETAKTAYIEELSAISAHLGEITDGSLFGSLLNFWTLTTKRGAALPRDFIGAFRVGGNDEYLYVEPQIVAGQVVGYSITFKVGKFEISSEYSKLNGELIIQTNEQSLDRTKITPDGTYYQHRQTVEDSWETIASTNVNGIKTRQLFSDDVLYITNQDMAQRRKEGFDVGNPYLSDSVKIFHFDTDVFDQFGNNTLTIEDAPGQSHSLVGAENDSDDIDFTPAILAIAPYSTIGRSLYGQYSIASEFASCLEFTVDFWIQYIYAENQIIFDVGNNPDKIKMIVASGEIFFEKGLDDEDIPFNEEISMSRPYRQLHLKDMFFNDDDELLFNGPEDEEIEFEEKAEKLYNADFVYYQRSLQNGVEEFNVVEVTALDYVSMIENGLYEKTLAFNEPKGAHSYIRHEGLNYYEDVELADYNVSFEPNQWLHIGIVADSVKIAVFLNENTHCPVFNRYGMTALPLQVNLNTSKDSFLLDELMVDTTTTESNADFILHTHERKPWAKLPDNENYFILTAKDIQKFETNIFDTQLFKDKVNAIIDERNN